MNYNRLSEFELRELGEVLGDSLKFLLFLQTIVQGKELEEIIILVGKINNHYSEIYWAIHRLNLEK